MTRTTLKRTPRSLAAQAGMTIIEILVGISIMAIAAGAIAFLVGAAVQAKMITAVRAGDTESVRESLGRMAERLRNGGLNIAPGSQTQLRCKDRVVAQDSLLLPTANSVYVSGDIMIASPWVPNTGVVTIGYYRGADPVTGSQVVMEYNQTCSSGATSIAANSTPLSSPKVPVTSLSFAYYDATGAQVTDLITPSSIQKIWIIKISMTVTASQGMSGTQTATLSRYVMFRDPDPQLNNWVDQNENF